MVIIVLSSTDLHPWFLAEGRWLPRNSGFCVLSHVFREIPEQSLWRVTLFRVDHRLSKSPSLSFIFRPLFCPPIPQHNAVWRTMGEKQGPGMHNISIFSLYFLFLDMTCLKSKPGGSMIMLKSYYKSPECVQYRRRTHLWKSGTDLFW